MLLDLNLVLTQGSGGEGLGVVGGTGQTEGEVAREVFFGRTLSEPGSL